MKLRTRFAALAVVGGLLFGGAVAAPIVAAPTAAEAKTTCKSRVVGYTKPGLYGPICWFNPGMPDCKPTAIVRFSCGGKF